MGGGKRADGMTNGADETRRLADFLHGIAFGDLAGEEVAKAKLFLLDFIGYAVASVGEESARLIRRVVRAQGGVPEATVLGSPWRTAPAWAAMVNGALGHISELDDTHRGTQTHPANAVMPAVLALGERTRADGRTAVAAIVAGYDCVLRVGAAGMPSHYSRGWHPSGTVHTFGAAAAAAKMLGLSAPGLGHALGLAGAQAAGNFAHVASRGLAKDLNPAKAAFNGVLAALLAREGFTGAPDILESPKGFLALTSVSPRPERLVAALGRPFLIGRVAHKPFPGCRHLHAARDAALEIAARHGVGAEAVESLTVRLFRTGARVVDDPEPWAGGKGLFGPHYSVQFQVALALAEGEAGLWRSFDHRYLEARLADPRIRALMARIQVVHDDELDRTWPETWSTAIEIRTRAGAAHTARVDLPRGEPENPMREDEVERKFEALAAPVFPAERRRAIREAVAGLEGLEDVSALAGLLAGGFE